MVEAYVPPKRQFLEEPHGVTFQKTAFFIVTAVKTSDLTNLFSISSRILPYIIWLRLSYLILPAALHPGLYSDSTRNQKQSK
jgi:hypothetical protein